jgi:hypothetical protein
MIYQMNDAPGVKIKIEYKIKTPEGSKPVRYSDVNVKYPDGTEMNYQIGKQTSSGIPTTRERAAISDIHTAGKPVTFVPYNDINYQWYLAFWGR